MIFSKRTFLVNWRLDNLVQQDKMKSFLNTKTQFPFKLRTLLLANW